MALCGRKKLWKLCYTRYGRASARTGLSTGLLIPQQKQNTLSTSTLDTARFSSSRRNKRLLSYTYSFLFRMIHLPPRYLNMLLLPACLETHPGRDAERLAISDN